MRFFLKVATGLVCVGSAYLLSIVGQYAITKRRFSNLEIQLAYHEDMYLKQQNYSRWHDEPVQAHLKMIWKLKEERVVLTALLNQMRADHRFLR